MNGTIPIIQVIFGGLLGVAVLAIMGLVCSSLCLHALGGVKARMATTERLDTVKAELERHLEHKINGATQPLTRAVDELRESISESNSTVSGIRTSSDALNRQMDLMSHSLMRIHQEQVNRLLDQIGIVRSSSGGGAPAAAGEQPSSNID